MRKSVKIILILAIAGVLALGIHILRTRQYENWLPAEGVITDVQFNRSYRKKSSRYSYQIYYEYTVAGAAYTGTNTYSGKKSDTDAAAGKQVTVWYDPDAPDKSSYHKSGTGIDFLIPIIIAFIPIRVILKQKGRKRSGSHK